MASILCSKCSQGIHYHGEPNGIQYAMITKADWDKIKSSKFDPSHKIIDPMNRYPKLFRTDTIEDDFPETVKKFWKCPFCGTLHFFDSEGLVLSAYEPGAFENENGDFNNIEGWYFDDYKWDKLTEEAIPDFLLQERWGSLDEIIISDKNVSMRHANDDHVATYKVLK